MADVPRDPRQLARDILAGRISIEELAREQQRRAGGMIRPPQARAGALPERIPLPRPVQAPARPVARQVPMAAQRSAPRPPVVIKPAAPRRVPGVPAQAVSRMAVTPQAPAGPVAPLAPAVPTESYTTPVKQTAAAAGQLAIGKIMQNRAALRQCIVMAEVLGKPVALRDEW